MRGVRKARPTPVRAVLRHWSVDKLSRAATIFPGAASEGQQGNVPIGEPLQVGSKRPVKYRSAAATGVQMGTGRLEGGEQVGLPDPAHSALGSYAALSLSACRAFCQ